MIDYVNQLIVACPPRTGSTTYVSSVRNAPGVEDPCDGFHHCPLGWYSAHDMLLEGFKVVTIYREPLPRLVSIWLKLHTEPWFKQVRGGVERYQREDFNSMVRWMEEFLIHGHLGPLGWPTSMTSNTVPGHLWYWTAPCSVWSSCVDHVPATVRGDRLILADGSSIPLGGRRLNQSNPGLRDDLYLRASKNDELVSAIRTYYAEDLKALEQLQP